MRRKFNILKHNWRKKIFAVALIAICFSSSGMGLDITEEKENLTPVQEEETYLPKEETITMAAVGDIMMHIEEVQAAYNKNTKSYSFDYMFKPVKSYIEEADIAIGNLETTFAGKEKGYSGYPTFNTPDQLAKALKNTGFDVLATANNHCMDKKFEGLSRTLKVLDEAGLAHTGTARTKEEAEKILIKEVKGIKVAFLAYTYGTNGIKIDKGKEFSVNRIDKNKILKDIKKAKENEVDVICTCIHFGEEYKRQPNKNQKDLVEFLASNGVDIIIGSHPHVLQPMEMRKVNALGKEKEVFVIYSMGNFISAQVDRYKDSSIILNLSITKNLDTNEIKIHNIKYLPTWVDLSRIQGDYHFRVLPVKKYIDLYDKKQDSLLSAKDRNRMGVSYNDTLGIFKGVQKWASISD